MSKEFNTNMLREKFIIMDNLAGESKPAPIVAMSNRFVVPLKDNSGRIIETFVVRAQNMHSCVRMVSKIYNTYDKQGPISSRGNKFNWAEAWEEIIEGYERKYNENCWVAIYHEGKIIYQHKSHHVFLDMIEKCQQENQREYENSVKIAQESLKKAGKDVEISHDSGIALVVNESNGVGRCGVILRSASRTATFNFTAKASVESKSKVSINQCLVVSAAFLEGIQLAFLVGRINGISRTTELAKDSREMIQSIVASDRLKNIEAAIDSFENTFNVSYRPEKPDFDLIKQDAEEMTL